MINLRCGSDDDMGQLSRGSGTGEWVCCGTQIFRRAKMLGRAILFSIVAVCLASSTTRAASPPNVIHIMLDEWGYYEWSAMGHPILDTPNIDALAASGMRFTQMLAGGNVCAPTRCTLMTGLHSGHSTVRSNGGRAPLRDEDVTIAERLRTAGYATGGFGKWGVGDRGTSGVPERQGFDLFFGYYHQVHAHTYYPNYLLRNSEKIALPGNTGHIHQGKTFAHELIYQESVKFIRDNHEGPFYAYLCWTPPHGHWSIPADDPGWLKYKDKKWDNSNQRGQHDAQIYAAMIEMIDRQVGQIMDLLKELGIDDNTVVILSGDNGGQPYFKNKRHPDGFFRPNVDPRSGQRFRGGKGNFYEGGLRIPFIVRWPGKVKSATQSNHLGYFPDMMPTLCELARIEPPSQCDGISFLPTLLGEPQQNHEHLYWEDPRAIAVRLGDWKGVKQLRKGSSPDWELYNLATDIGETRNVAASHAAVVAKIDKIAQQAHQPAVRGRVLDPTAGFQGHQAK